MSDRINVVIRGAGVLVVAGVLAGGGAYVIQDGGGEPPEGTAHIWVDTDGGNCVDDSSPGDYVDADACGSLDAANDTCETGDTVLVAGGNYTTAQSISGANGRTSMGCTIEAADTENPPMMKQFNVSGVKFLTVRGMNSLTMNCANGGISCSDNTFTPDNRRAINVSNGTEDVVIDEFIYGGFNITDSRRVTISNSELGPCWSWDTTDGGGESCPNGPIQYCEVTELGCTGYNEGHTITGNRFFDYGCDESFYAPSTVNECHHECMYLTYAKDLTITKNTFVNCANGGNIFWSYSNGGGSFTADFGADNVLIENNVFTQTCSNGSSGACGGTLEFAMGVSGHCNIYSGTDLTDVTVQFNTFVGGAGFDLSGGCTHSNVVFRGNIRNGQSFACGGSWSGAPTFAYETTYNGGNTCGGNGQNLGGLGTTLDGLIVGPDNDDPDPHLTGAANDLDGFVATGCPAEDIDGDARPSTNCDAGADER